MFYFNCNCFTAFTSRRMLSYLGGITSFIQVGFDQGCAVDKSSQRCCRSNQDVYVYGGIHALNVRAAVCDWPPPVGYNHNNAKEKIDIVRFLVGHFLQMWHDLPFIFSSIWGSLLWRCGKSAGRRTYW